MRHFKSLIVIVLIAILFLGPTNSPAQPQESSDLKSSVFVSSPAAPEPSTDEAQALASSFTDHAATIAHVKGDVRILREGTDGWTPVEENENVQQGNQIKTGSGGSTDIVYDHSSLNVVHLDENTIAVFRAIEPTDLYLTDGSIFNSLQGLPQGESYEVATAVSITGVRGTQFLRIYIAADQSDSTIVSDGTVASVPILSDGSRSKESVLVRKNSVLVLTPETLRTTPPAEIRPLPATEEHLRKMEDVSRSVESHLERFAGGHEVLERRRERAQAMMKEPHFHEKLREQGGKGSIGQPSAPPKGSGPPRDGRPGEQYERPHALGPKGPTAGPDKPPQEPQRRALPPPRAPARRQ